MADPNPLAGMPLAETLASNMNESLQWMSRMWGSAAAATPAGASLPPGLASMLMPTLDPNELDKRISDLKTVEHWLDMNRALLHTTIQTLEMQRNGIVALQSMARSAQAGASGVAGGSPAAAGPGFAAQGPTDSPMGMPPMPFNPAQWWGLLQDQFARVAATAAAEPERPAAAAAPTPEADPPRPKRQSEPPPSPAEGRSGRKPPGA
jgi:hypothetical protein